MSRSYKKKTNRSKRKMIQMNKNAATVSLANGQATFQIVLPMGQTFMDIATSIEKTATKAGLLMIQALVNDEVEQLAGERYQHQSDREAVRWGQEEGHVIYAGRKVAMKKPRVRSADGHEEISLPRWNLFSNPRKMEQSIRDRILRRVSCRDYEGVLDDVCDGYGVDKSSVSRHWKAASSKQLQTMMERPLKDLDLVAIMIDGKGFHENTLITALGVDSSGEKHVLGLWPGATENSEVCGTLLDELLERGLNREKHYLFVLDGAKALKAAVRSHWGESVLIQRCRIHKERNIRKYLPKSQHHLLSMKLKAAFGMSDYAAAEKELRKVQAWLGTINEAAAKSLTEGFDELLTMNRLQLPEMLSKHLDNTNLIENCFSVEDDLCRNVKRWRNANMAWRWAGTVLLEVEKRFHRISGYKQLPLLQTRIDQLIDKKKASA
jgi:transposase-like protein